MTAALETLSSQTILEQSQFVRCDNCLEVHRILQITPEGDQVPIDRDGLVCHCSKAERPPPTLEERIDQALALEQAHDKHSGEDNRVSNEALIKLEIDARNYLRENSQPSIFENMNPDEVIAHARKITRINARVQALAAAVVERKKVTRRVRVIRAVHVEYDVPETLTDEEAIHAIWVGESRAQESWRSDYDELVGKEHCQVIVLDGKNDEDPPWPKEFDLDLLI